MGVLALLGARRLRVGSVVVTPLRNTPTWVTTPAEAAARGLEHCDLCGSACLPWTLAVVPEHPDQVRVCDDCRYWLARDAEVLAKDAKARAKTQARRAAA